MAARLPPPLVLGVLVVAALVITTQLVGGGGAAAAEPAPLAPGVTLGELRKELRSLRHESALALNRTVVAAMKRLTARMDRAAAAAAGPAAHGAGGAVTAAAAAAAAQPVGLRACARNAYLEAWDDGAYARAAAALREFRSTLVRKAHGSHWAVGDHSRFGINPDVQPCGPLARLGEGDGGKWVCNLHAKSLRPGCVIYSVGSDYNVDFERDLLAATPCEVFTFDCTVKPDDERYKVYNDLPARLHFQRLCLGEAGPNTDAEMRPRFRTLASITQELGHSSIALLKMDIEGSEYEVIEDFTRGFLAAQSQGGPAAVLPDQVLFEQHFKTHTDLKWAHNDDGLHAGEMALMWVQLADMGYVPVSREDNIYCKHCSEFAVARAFC